MSAARSARISVAILAAGLLSACSSPAAPPPAPERLHAISAPPELARPGAAINGVQVRLMSADDRPVAGHPVVWSGDGITDTTTYTDGLGYASINWILPRWSEVVPVGSTGPSGTYRLQAVVEGVGRLDFQTTAHSFRADEIDAAFDYGCGIRSNQLWCWGRAWPLAALVGRVPPSRVALPEGATPTHLRAVDMALCIIDQHQLARCAARDEPVPFGPVAGAPPLSQLDGSTMSTTGARFCGISALDRTPWCWEVAADRIGPASQVASLPVEYLATGRGFWCGFDERHDVWCQGVNDRGQLGDGTLVDRDQAVRVVGLPEVVSLGAGASAACAAEADGEIWCWGHGPLPEQSSTPQPVTIPGIRGTDIAVSNGGESFVIVDGMVRVWHGTQELPLFRFADRLNVVEVSGDGQACVRTVTGEVYCSWIMVHGGGDTSPYPSELVSMEPG